MKKADRVCVGVVTGSYGVRGEARIKSFCAEPSAIADYSPLSSEDGNTLYSVVISRPVKGGFVVKLGSVTSKEQADGLKGAKLFAERDDLPALPDDEYYYTDLIGLEVLDTGGATIGRVKAVFDHGAGDILEVTGPNIKGAALIPFTKDIVPTVDYSAGRLIVDLPDGLLSTASDDT